VPSIARNVPLTCSVSPGSGYVVVSVAGEVDAGTEQDLRDELAAVLHDGTGDVVVDLDRVRFMASAGIGVLLGARRVLADSGRQLVLAAPKGEVAQVLMITGISDVVPVAESVAAAVARLS
jgi:anti-sigma B factor antagonist